MCCLLTEQIVNIYHLLIYFILHSCKYSLSLFVPYWFLVLTAADVNVTMSTYIYEDDHGIGGHVAAKYGFNWIAVIVVQRGHL